MNANSQAIQELKMSGKKILIIDDEPHIRESLGFMLKKMGYSVRTEDDSTKVLGILEHERFDIVVSDVTMPKLSGHELVRQLHKKYPDINVILISGHQDDDGEDDDRGEDHKKSYHYLTKPFSMSDLIGCLNSI